MDAISPWQTSPQLATRKYGHEQLHEEGNPIGQTVLDFWRWSASDLVNNAQRGILAEFLVAHALGLADGTRVEWDSVDLRTADGVHVEVKSAAFLQAWRQERPSVIRFDVARKMVDPAAPGGAVTPPTRHAHVYVFCLLHHRELATLDPIDVAQWTFFVVSRRQVDSAFGAQKSVGLRALTSMGVAPVRYVDLAAAVEIAAAELGK